MAGPPQVGPATEFHTGLAAQRTVGVRLQGLHGHSHRHHAHRVGVGLVKDGPQALNGFGDGKRRLLGIDRLVFLDKGVDNDLSLADLLDRHGGLGREVEAESVRRYQRPALVRVGRQDCAESKVENVRPAVVVHHVLAALLIDGELGGVPDIQAALHGAHVEHVAAPHLHVLHLELVLSLDDEALVVDLAALLGVEAGPVQEDPALLPTLN